MIRSTDEEHHSAVPPALTPPRPSIFGKKTGRIEPLLFERQRWFCEAEVRLSQFGKDDSGTIWEKELSQADELEIRKRAQNELKGLMGALDDPDKFFSYFFLPENLTRFHRRYMLLEQTSPAVITEKYRNERYQRTFLEHLNQPTLPVKLVFSLLPFTDEFQRAKERSRRASSSSSSEVPGFSNEEGPTMNWQEFFQKYFNVNHVAVQIGCWLFDWQEPGVVIPHWCYDPSYSHFFKNSPFGLEQWHIHKDLVFPLSLDGDCQVALGDVKKICKKISEWNRYWSFSERAQLSNGKKVSGAVGFADKILSMIDKNTTYKPDGYLDTLMKKLRNNAQLGTDAIRLYDLPTQKEVRVLAHPELVRYYQLQMRSTPNGPVDPELQMLVRAVEHLLLQRNRATGDTKNMFFKQIDFNEPVVIKPDPVPSPIASAPPLVDLPSPISGGADTSKLMSDTDSEEEISNILSQVKFSGLNAYDAIDMVIAHYKKRVAELQREIQAEKVARRRDREVFLQKMNEVIAQRAGKSNSDSTGPGVLTSELDALLDNSDSKSEFTAIPRKPFKSFKDIGFAEDMNPRHRRNMEDGHCMIDCFGGMDKMCFFGIYDGHGGRQAVDYVQSALHSRILDELRKEAPGIWSGSLNDSSIVKKAISTAYSAVDEELKELGCLQNGTTVITCLVITLGNERVIFSSNAGDARIVMCREGKEIRLTKDHKPGEEDEIKRIKDAGGFVAYNRVNGILAVARSLGDHAMKEWVIGTPDHSITTSQGSSDFLILACDGLWDVISDKDAVDFVSKCFAEFSKAPLSPSNGPDTTMCLDAARKLLARSLQLGTRDNVSIMIVRL